MDFKFMRREGLNNVAVFSRGRSFCGMIAAVALTMTLTSFEEAYASPLVLKEILPAEGTVNAADEWWEYFESINLIFDQAPILSDGATVTLTHTASGLEETIVPNMMFVSFGSDSEGYTVLLNPSEDMNLNGEYVLTIPTGIFLNEAGESYAGGSFNYIVSGLATGNEDVADNTPLTITDIWLGEAKDSDEKNAAGNFIPCVDMATATIMTEGMTLPAIKENDAIEVEFNHSDKAKSASWRIYDVTADKAILSGWMGKLSNGHFTMSPGWIDIELLKNHEYTLTFHTYNQEHSQGQIEYGDGVSLTLYGDTEEFSFSEVTYIGSFPESDSFEIKSIDDNTITLVFSDAVRINEEESSVTYGWGISKKFDEVIYNRLNPNVVKVVIPESCITGEDNALRLSIAAYDLSGLLVEGNNGIDGESRIEESYKCNVASDAPVLTGEWHRIPDTSLFRIKSSAKNEYIIEGFHAYPYLATTAGVKVADFDDEYGFVTISESKFEGADAPTELEFRLIDPETGNPFNRAGYYNLVLPSNTFVQGQGQMIHRSSKMVTYPVEIAEFVTVNHMVAGHLNSMGKVVKGSTATFKITPAEDWVVETITLNGEDITEAYSDGILTTPALNENALIATDMAYDGEFYLTTGIDDVVSTLELRVWSENGEVCVGGVKAGQQLSLYSINGALMMEETIAEDGEARFKVPQSQAYIIIVNDGSRKVAIKVVNI